MQEREKENEQKLRYEFLLDSFLNRLKKSPCVIYRNSLVCLIDEKDVDLFTGDSPASITDLLRFYGLVCGISNEIADPEKLSMYYDQACTTLNLVRCLKDSGLYFFHKDYSVYSILDTVYSLCSIPLPEYCYPKYMQLLKFDSENDTNYALTLSAYLECGHDSMRTAELMHVHRNTIIYRLKRMEELFGICLNDADELFSIHFTLRILRYLGVKQDGPNLPESSQ
ncbi:MAG: helix-turn-helix domain-containing protein [Oscillospiraceae bacterium]|nr:helix-turn-helix domain-containing protein [Oscillospiraceae bacterium]